jgi:hypothetical protein
MKNSPIISVERIVDALYGFFKAGSNSVCNVLKDFSKDQEIFINEEIIALSTFSVIRSVFTACGNNIVSENIIEKFKQKVLKHHFKTDEEKENFKKLFSKRYEEYSELFSSENSNFENLDFHIGQIFCEYFFGKADESFAIIMMSVGYVCFATMIETTKFLNEVISRYSILL